jgi:hypothetical protein
MDELERPGHEAAREHALAKRAHAQLGPDAAQRARMLERLETAIAPSPAEPRAEGRAFRVPRLAAHKGWLWLLSLLALLAGVGSFVMTRGREEAPEAESRRTPLRAPVPVATPVPMPAPATSLPTSPEPAEPQAKRSRRDAASAPDPIAELVLLERARRIMARDPARTLALTEQHRTSFRTPNFAEERELLAIEALVRSHQRGAAERRARAFTRSYPQSLHTHRLKAILQGDAS